MSLVKTNIKPCPFCGEQFHIYEEDVCSQHSSEIWYSVGHYCVVDIEYLQKGGDVKDLVKRLNTRFTAL